ncbi:hypothetical protein F1737_06175 [Methanoplanus sp. FWC-SCC4]|uniref:Uncharacterized protein n=1 Tax=Methanochimaera problematica TaxID=2609417 RepID=A0AA97I3W8_9EURY|nr:hypothetical protein [Methanoplanus sp. FWC-SCC4]WOF16331.1 hypothetical protein F1737_06175 [Methanoplanus sp. FWC-SCC4]
MKSGSAQLFAGELNLSKEEKTGFLISPSGVHFKKVYITGALTEVLEKNSYSPVKARIADPTGVFLIHARRSNPHVISVLKNSQVPAFMAVYGTAEVFREQKHESVRIIPENVSVISKENRDSWINGTALLAIERIEDEEKKISQNDVKILLGYINTAIRAVSIHEEAHETCEENLILKKIPLITEYIERNSKSKGMLLEDLYAYCNSIGISEEITKKCIENILDEGDCYLPAGGYIKLL